MDGEYLVVNPVNGLGNRLRSLASFGVLANELNIPLFVHWASSAGFDDTCLEELVQTNDLNLVDAETWENMKEVSLSVSDCIEGVCDNSVSPFHKDKRNHYVNGVLSGKFRQMSATTSNMLSWALGPYEVEKHIKNFKPKYKQFLRKLKPSNKVIQAASIPHARFTSNIIGVHIRQGDATSNKNEWSNMFSHKIIDAITEHFDKTKNQIFLCTDDEGVLNEMQTRYKERIIVYEKRFVDSVYGAPKGGQLDAMVELYLLSQTDKILATGPSSFSKLAADWGDKNYFTTKSIINTTGNAKKMIQILQS